MKNTFWLFLLAFIAINSCQFPNYVDLSDEIIEYNIPVEGLSSMKASGIYYINIEKGASEALTVKCNSNLKDYLQIKQRGQAIFMDMDNISTDSDVVLEVTLTVVDLDEIALSGATKLKMKGLGFDNLELSLSGASSMKASEYRGNKLAVDGSGASGLKIDGTVKALESKLSGASYLKGKSLTITELADIAGSGACQFSLFCDGKLSVHLSGASNLSCYGSPDVISQELSGASSLKLKDK